METISEDNDSNSILPDLAFGKLLIRPVPPDHSCLFSSILFAIHGEISPCAVQKMRHIVANEISAHPFKYTDVVLNQTPSEYCDWVLESSSWGGAIEIGIFAHFFRIEIDVAQKGNSMLLRFGNEANYKWRIFILYDGTHYDPLYMIREDGEIVSIFAVDDVSVCEQAQSLTRTPGRTLNMPLPDIY